MSVKFVSSITQMRRKTVLFSAVAVKLKYILNAMDLQLSQMVFEYVINASTKINHHHAFYALIKQVCLEKCLILIITTMFLTNKVITLSCGCIYTVLNVLHILR